VGELLASDGRCAMPLKPMFHGMPLVGVPISSNYWVPHHHLQQLQLLEDRRSITSNLPIAPILAKGAHQIITTAAQCRDPRAQALFASKLATKELGSFEQFEYECKVQLNSESHDALNFAMH